MFNSNIGIVSSPMRELVDPVNYLVIKKDKETSNIGRSVPYNRFAENRT